MSVQIIFVYGNEWVAGNFSYHLKDRPIWVSDKFSKKIEGKILICGKSNKNEKTGCLEYKMGQLKEYK